MNHFLKGINNECNAKQRWLVLLLFTVVAFLFYGNVLTNGYSLDDQFIYTSNKIAINGLNDVTAIFTNASFDYGSFKFGYRPIAVLSFAIENELFGVNAKVSHLINLLLYLFSAFVLFQFLLRLFPKEKLLTTFLVALFFIILPIHTEIVNNVKCRDELLMLLFGLLACHQWAKRERKLIQVFSAIIFLLISILSKKTGFIFLGVLPLITFFISNGNRKKSLITLLLMLSPVVLFKLIIKFFKEGKNIRIYHFVENPLFGGDLSVSKFTMVAESLWFYLKSLFLPTQFVAYYGYRTIPIDSIQMGGILGLILCVLLLLLSLRVFKDQKAYLFGSIVLLGGLLPIVNLMSPMVGIVAERFITVGSIGFCLFVIYGTEQLTRKLRQPKLQVVAVVVLLGYGAVYFPLIKERNKEWNSEISVMEADVEKVPGSVILNTNLASIYNQQLSRLNGFGKAQKGKRIIELCKRANSVYPTSSAYFYLGSTQYLVFKDAEKAETNLLNAIELDSTDRGAMNNLALLYKDVGNRKQSILWFKSLIDQYPDQENAYPHLAQQLVGEGEFQESLKWVKKGIDFNGVSYGLALSFGNTYYLMGDLKNAELWYEKVLVIQPNNEAIRNRLMQVKNQTK